MANINYQQEKFVAAYVGIANGNATEAARIAGYKQPGSYGHDLLKKPEIQQAITEYRAEVKALGIAHQQNRIDAANDRHRRMQRVMDERAADPFYADVPGGTTGIVLKRIKTVKHIYEPDPEAEDGRTHQVTIEQWEVEDNVALLREMREHEKQVAQEVGDWSEKSEIEHSGVRREYVVVRETQGPPTIPIEDDPLVTGE